MSADRTPRWPSLIVLAGSAAVIALMVLLGSRYPHTLDSKGAVLLLTVAAIVLATYLVLGVLALRRGGEGRRLGAGFGALAALMWMVEIWAGGPAKLSYYDEQIVGGTFALLAVFVTVAAGPVAALSRRTAGTELRAGVFAGLTSGVLLFGAANLMTFGTLHTLATRSDYQHQFAASGAPNISTFLISDMLGASIAHLVINLLLGLAGGVLGAQVARSISSGVYARSTSK